jgi:hypothetical protein
MKKQHWYLLIISYLLIYGGICIFVSSYTNFHVGLNDFWGFYYLSENLDINTPESLSNRFSPIGYPIFLKLLSFGNQIVAAHLINIFFGLAMLGGIAYLCAITVGPAWAMLCVLILSILPKFSDYITIPGPDIGMAAFLTIGGVLLLRASVITPKDDRIKRLIIMGGIFCGLSALWRYHGLVMAFGLILFTAIVSRKVFRHFILGFSSMMFVYAIQIFFNILSGRSPFETASSFNAFISTHGVSWHNVSQILDKVPKSVLAVIIDSPSSFIQMYIPNVLRFLPYFIPALLCVFLLKKKIYIKIGIIITLTFILYVLVVAVGARLSGRGDIPLLSFTVYSTVVLLKFMRENYLVQKKENKSIATITLTAILCVVIILFSSFFMTNYRQIKQRRMANMKYLAIESVLLEEGTVSHARQIFSDDFDLYFPHFTYYRPYLNGGWRRYDLSDYNEKYPDLAVDSVESFLEDCHRHNISHLVLTSRARRLSPQIQKIYSGKITSNQITKIANFPGIKVFRISKLNAVIQD